MLIRYGIVSFRYFYSQLVSISDNVNVSRIHPCKALQKIYTTGLEMSILLSWPFLNVARLQFKEVSATVIFFLGTESR